MRATDGRRERDERGSMAVEVVLLAPLLMMFVMLVVAGGRYVSVQGDIEAAARDAARAASLENQRGEAESVARQVVVASLDENTSCAGFSLGGEWRAGGSVVVHLSCRVSYDGLGLLGVPGSVAIDTSSTVPLDPYRSFE
jgi:Flp pilus assembly protein TadG